MCTFGLSGCRVKPQRLRGCRGTRELQTCTFERPSTSNTIKIPRKDQQEREKRMKTVAGEGKKKGVKFWAPHPSPHPPGPHPSGPHFFQVWASTLRGPTLCGPKIQHPKIGRSRNWPKSKLAEVEIGRTRKKKLAEVEIGRSRPRSKFRTFLSHSLHNFRSFSLSLCVFSLNFGGFCEDRDPQMCTYELSGC